MIPILYKDAHYVIVHKPPGLLMHRSPLSRDEQFLLQQVRDQVGTRVYPAHRLDRATSGVVAFGLDAEAARRLGRAFMSREVEKVYLALARGWVEEGGLIDHPVRDDDAPAATPRPALTRYRRVARVEVPVAVDRYPTSRYSLVAVTPETGRRQQIRRHFKHISHHLVGDTTHGNGRHNRYFRTEHDIHRLMLTSALLGFEHPFTGERVRVRAAPEAAWLTLASRFGWGAALAAWGQAGDASPTG